METGCSIQAEYTYKTVNWNNKMLQVRDQ